MLDVHTDSVLRWFWSVKTLHIYWLLLHYGHSRQSPSGIKWTCWFLCINKQNKRNFLSWQFSHVCPCELSFRVTVGFYWNLRQMTRLRAGSFPTNPPGLPFFFSIQMSTALEAPHCTSHSSHCSSALVLLALIPPPLPFLISVCWSYDSLFLGLGLVNNPHSCRLEALQLIGCLVWAEWVVLIIVVQDYYIDAASCQYGFNTVLYFFNIKPSFTCCPCNSSLWALVL